MAMATMNIVVTKRCNEVDSEACNDASFQISSTTELIQGNVVLSESKKKRKRSLFGTLRTTFEHDDGHRYGNFHNYYRFHPPQERSDLMSRSAGIIETVADGYIQRQLAMCLKSNENRVFKYMDVGCNEGDLTMQIANLLHDELSKAFSSQKEQKQDTAETAISTLTKKSRSIVDTTGLDIDPVLIQRAQMKFKSINCSTEELGNTDAMIKSKFRQVDVLEIASRESHRSTEGGEGYSSVESESGGEYDFTSLLSTTMWIHIHGGDEGLIQVLKWICEHSKLFVLLEPQPSKCYSKASMRWRRRHPGGGSSSVPPFPDVSCNRLKLRANIEESVDNIMLQNGFEFVGLRLQPTEVVPGLTVDTVVDDNCKTSWNRSLRLYRRKNSN